MSADVHTVPELVVIPFTLYLLGCGIYLAQLLAGRQAGALPRRRWGSAILVLIGIIVAFQPAWQALNPDTGRIYRLMLTRKVELVQISTPFIGVGLLIAMIAVDLLSKRYIRAHYMD